jgi:hypothetical protein
LPIILAYLSFAGMVYFTLKMFHNKNLLDKMAVWERLIRFFREKSREKTQADGSGTSKTNQENDGLEREDEDNEEEEILNNASAEG